METALDAIKCELDEKLKDLSKEFTTFDDIDWEKLSYLNSLGRSLFEFKWYKEFAGAFQLFYAKFQIKHNNNKGWTGVTIYDMCTGHRWNNYTFAWIPDNSVVYSSIPDNVGVIALGKDALISSRIKYIIICLGTTSSFLRQLPIISLISIIK